MRNLLSKMTPAKMSNAAQVYSSYYYSKSSGRLMAPHMPFSLAFEPTTSCNLRCPECPSGLRSFTRPTGMLNMDFFRDQIDALQQYLIYLTFYFQGEPYLNPKFLDMTTYAHSKGIYTSTSTNAHYLNDEVARNTVESGLDRLIISIDGTTQDTYESYRIGGKLEKVLEGTRNVVRWKKALKSITPHIVFQYLVVKPNEHQINDAKKLSKELGVNQINFKTAQIYDYEDGSPLIPSIQKYSRYTKGTDEKYHIKNPMNNHCWKMWHSAVITWDGKVIPCCFDKDASHEMGNVEDLTFKEIWNSGKYDAFRKSLLKSRSEIDICKNCSEGLEVFAGT